MAKESRAKIPLLPPGWRFILYLSATVIFLLTGRGEAGAAMESHFLYFPDHHLRMTPGNVGLDYEDVVFPAADGTMLHGWFIPGAEEQPAVLFFHGNAGNISDRVDNLVRLSSLGLAVFIFDYRGYGRSQGKSSEAGIYSDGRGAIAWLEKRGFQANQTIYFGRSLGAAAALQLALEEPPAGLILESPFTSVRAMGREHYPLLAHLFGWLIPAKYANDEKIGRLKSPLLLIHGTADRIVPVAMGQRLYELAPAPKKLYLLAGADHNDAYFLTDPEYWHVWQDFLRSIQRIDSPGGKIPL